MKRFGRIRNNPFLFFATSMLVFSALLMLWNNKNEEPSFLAETTNATVQEQKKVIEVIRQAEESFYEPFQHTKQIKLNGKNVRVFTEPYTNTEAIFKHYRKNWHDSMADNLTSEAIDWSMSKEGKGLIAKPRFDTFNVLHLSDDQLYVVDLSDEKATIEAFVDDDAGKQHLIQYELVRDSSNKWVIQRKIVR